MRSSEIADNLKQKLSILEDISTNTIKQKQFIHKGEMRGLRRLLKEREKLLGELAAVCCELRSDTRWQQMKELQSLVWAIEAKQREIVADSVEVLQETILERDRVAAKLRNIRSGRQLKNRYVGTWETLRSGRCFNVKG